MKALIVPGSVITNKTAKSYLIKLCKMLYSQTMNIYSANLLSDIEERMVNIGFFDWDEIENIEDLALKELSIENSIVNKI